jgi:hypothetical protein
MIKRRGKQHCVVSEKGKNLGCGPTAAWAKKRLGQVEYFKHAHKSLTEADIASGLDDGSLQVSKSELAGFLVENKSLLEKTTGVVFDDVFIQKHLIDHEPDEIIEEGTGESLATVDDGPTPPVVIDEPDDPAIDVLLHRVQKADDKQTKCLKYIYLKYRIYYSGQKIYAALQLWNKNKYPEAAAAFAEARDGFEKKQNPNEYNCLDGWSKKAEGMKAPAEA